MIRVYFAAAVLLALGGSANATTFTFNTPPFGGTNVRAIPGRQIVGGEAFLPAFDLGTDLFSFDASVFGVSSTVSFADGLASTLPTTGVNVVVLQNTDDDNNPLTPFGAGNAADLIAARITQSTPGFFIYMNSDLNLRRLVYSTDLSDNQADLQILARILNPIGATAIHTLPNFAANDFEITAPAPEPTTMGLIGACLLLGSATLRRLKVR